MSVSEMFSEFVANLAISNSEVISQRYGEITAALNKQFRETESKTANTLQVGSFGRKTGINGISDLDMLYIMPKSKWDDYRDGKQAKLLQDTKAAILKRYPMTKVRVDRLVVTVTYTDFYVEVQPVFEQDDRSFLYPDTKSQRWKVTRPREEMEAVANLDVLKNSNLRRLCKMARAWKNKHGVGMGGLLVDTLAYNFFISTSDYDTKSYLYYDELSRDFFGYLADLQDQDEYAAPGSRQRVKVKRKFQRKARKAHRLCLEAIAAEDSKGVNDKWKKVYGRPFPAAKTAVQEARTKAEGAAWDDTEQFIEDRFPLDIREHMRIDCEIKKNGIRELFLRKLLRDKKPLRVKKGLQFKIDELTVEPPYQIYWKVLNRGQVAQQRNCIRGQIEMDKGNLTRTETTDFEGDHIVECYCVKNGVVVAKDRIHVPIVAGEEDDE